MALDIPHLIAPFDVATLGCQASSKRSAQPHLAHVACRGCTCRLHMMLHLLMNASARCRMVSLRSLITNVFVLSEQAFVIALDAFSGNNACATLQVDCVRASIQCLAPRCCVHPHGDTCMHLGPTCNSHCFHSLHPAGVLPAEHSVRLIAGDILVAKM